MERNDTVRARILRHAVEHTIIDTPMIAQLLRAKASTVSSFLNHLASEGYIYPDGVVHRTKKKLYRISAKGREWLDGQGGPRKPDAGPLTAALGYSIRKEIGND